MSAGAEVANGTGPPGDRLQLIPKVSGPAVIRLTNAGDEGKQPGHRAVSGAMP
ncbi:hypothetical protein NG796_25810 [Laspinema sp. A4]|uniref:hypothetical protein n=1 Tax=Laspinema sp. D2d TaxID=2953686 RepID=UPI0021BA913B|nr:hypothetical protein [Laspinema sp. D2d]MCT7986694.1 hypothetical protein [Laspinema sp. D2d]